MKHFGSTSYIFCLQYHKIHELFKSLCIMVTSESLPAYWQMTSTLTQHNKHRLIIRTFSKSRRGSPEDKLHVCSCEWQLHVSWGSARGGVCGL